jgi:hypothetical protein
VYLYLCLLRISLARRPPAAITPRAIMHAPMPAAHAVGDTQQPWVKCILGTRTHAVALITDPDHAVLGMPQVCVHAQHLQHWTPSERFELAGMIVASQGVISLRSLQERMTLPAAPNTAARPVAQTPLHLSERDGKRRGGARPAAARGLTADEWTAACWRSFLGSVWRAGRRPAGGAVAKHPWM